MNQNEILLSLYQRCDYCQHYMQKDGKNYCYRLRKHLRTLVRIKKCNNFKQVKNDTRTTI